MMDCKKALTEANGDLEQAIVVLRKRGMASAAKKATRTTSEGVVTSYIHAGGKIGVLLEVNCESDFVARTDGVPGAGARHRHAHRRRRSALRPQGRRDARGMEREKDIYLAQAVASGKPANIAEKMVAGKMGKFYEEVCLLEQPFIKEQTVTISQLIATVIGKLGENISVRRFARFKVGEVGQTVAVTTRQSRDDGGEAATPAAK